MHAISSNGPVKLLGILWGKGADGTLFSNMAGIQEDVGVHFIVNQKTFMPRIHWMLLALAACTTSQNRVSNHTIAAAACNAGYDSLPATFSANSPVQAGGVVTFQFKVRNPCASVSPLRLSDNWPFYVVVTDTAGTEVWAPFRVVEGLVGVILDLQPGESKCLERDWRTHDNWGKPLAPGAYKARAALSKSGLYSSGKIAEIRIVESAQMPEARVPAGYAAALPWRFCPAAG